MVLGWSMVKHKIFSFLKRLIVSSLLPNLMDAQVLAALPEGRHKLQDFVLV
jgi:hypothetical protein